MFLTLGQGTTNSIFDIPAQQTHSSGQLTAALNSTPDAEGIYCNNFVMTVYWLPPNVLRRCLVISSCLSSSYLSSSVLASIPLEQDYYWSWNSHRTTKHSKWIISPRILPLIEQTHYFPLQSQIPLLFYGTRDLELGLGATTSMTFWFL